MYKLRENPETARVGLPWTSEEQQHLLSEIESDLSLEQIARQHQRTPEAIRQRLLWETWNRVHKEQVNVDEACKQLCVSREAFDTYEKRRPTGNQDNQNNLKILTEIQHSLVTITQQLEKLTKICDSLQQQINK